MYDVQFYGFMFLITTHCLICCINSFISCYYYYNNYSIDTPTCPAYLCSLLFPYEPKRALRLLIVSSCSIFQMWWLTLVGVPSATVPPRFGMKSQPPQEMLQLSKLSNTGSKPTCSVLRTIIKHNPTSHLMTAQCPRLRFGHILPTLRVIGLRFITVIIVRQNSW